jgi:hypothetical protein
MSLSPERFKELFPHASRSVLEINGQLQDAEPKRDKAPTLDATVKRETQGAQRVIVRFTGYRVRPLDPDNFAGSVKDLLDGLRHAHLIPGDEPWRIKLETDQERVGSYGEEKTEIRITWPAVTNSIDR